MFCMRFVQVAAAPALRTSVSRVTYVPKFGTTVQFPSVRMFADEGRQAAWKTARPRRRTFGETLKQPDTGIAWDLGTGGVAGVAALSIGALCYYGLGLSSESGIIENARLWPEYVRQRVRDTYTYFGGSLALTAGSAYAVFRSPAMFNLVSKNSWVAIGATIVAMLGTGMVAQSLPYSEGFGAKQVAWALHSAVIGAVIAPICVVGGPILIRAAWLTAGAVGGLSALAVCAPNDRFLYLGGPLGLALGALLASSVGAMFFPATTALGAGLHSFTLYGGLIIFSGFLLYDTQRIVKIAETHPLYGVPFDPVNASISIYLDTINIFIRIVTILAGGGNRKR